MTILIDRDAAAEALRTMRWYSIADAVNYDQVSHRPSVEKRLSEYFTKKQLALIELAFESGDKDHGTLPYYDADGSDDYHYNKYEVNIDSFPKLLLSKAEMDLAIKFGRKYRHDTDRFLAIMNNIIRNDGTFTLPKR